MIKLILILLFLATLALALKICWNIRDYKWIAFNCVHCMVL